MTIKEQLSHKLLEEQYRDKQDFWRFSDRSFTYRDKNFSVILVFEGVENNLSSHALVFKENTFKYRPNRKWGLVVNGKLVYSGLQEPFYGDETHYFLEFEMFRNGKVKRCRKFYINNKKVTEQEYWREL